MSTSAGNGLAEDVAIRDRTLVVSLTDGRTITVPLSWFPTLDAASRAELERWRLIGGGVGIRWPGLDEDVSVEGLLEPERTMRPDLGATDSV